MGKRTHGDAHGFAHSMTDLMAGVAVTFLLIAAIFMVQVAKSAERQKELSREASERLKKIEDSDESAKDALLSLRDSLQADASLRGTIDLIYDANKDPFLLTIVLDRQRVRFETGDCSILPETKALMSSSLRVIFGKVCIAEATGLMQSITLEGHTDNRPFFPVDDVCGIDSARGRCAEHPNSSKCRTLGFANNVRLSAARAQNVFFEMQRALASDEDVRSCLETKFVVAGRGPVEPLDGLEWSMERTPPVNEANRRVVIKVRAVARPLASKNSK